MFGKLLTKVFGSRNDRTLKGLQKVVNKINALEADYEKLTDDELLQKTPYYIDREPPLDALHNATYQWKYLVHPN